MKSDISFLFIFFIIIVIITFLGGMIETFSEGYGGHHGGGHHGGGHHGGRGWRRRGRRRGWGRRGWGPSFWPFYQNWGVCKNGCTSIGKGLWGCQYPGGGYNDCMFSDDCNGCGNNNWFW